LDVVPRRYPDINPKDEHVVAAALAIGADYLLTLDQLLAAEINGSGLPIRAISPREFIQTLLPTHPFVARLRDD
jgi:predicted nucleic acid-binding protein